jgi:predicted N-acetyltransferase YhbS
MASMRGYDLTPVEDDLTAAARIYREVGFRFDLIDDLKLVQSLGGAVYVARMGGEVIGVSSCLPFERTGWIGGVAVASVHERRGLGTALTHMALQALRSQGVKTALLHATEVARPLYLRTGFLPEGEYIALRGRALAENEHSTSIMIRPGAAADLPAILRLDAEATAESRGALLRELWPHGSRVAFETSTGGAEGTVRGYSLHQRRGAVAAVIADEESVGAALLSKALRENRVGLGEPMRVSVPEGNQRSRAYLASLGFEESLRTTRMRLGPPLGWRADHIFAAFNLYWG